MNHAPFPPPRGLHRWSGLAAAAVVSLSVVSGLLNLFATADAGHATSMLAQQPAAPSGVCGAADATRRDRRCDDAAPELARVSLFDDADTR